MGPLLNVSAFPIKVKKELGENLLKKDKEPVFITCKSCGRRALKRDWQNNYYVCPVCGKYKSIGAYYRLSLILDSGSS
jgi:acetyl-CoA carboxylase carboxyl transferase subunit beta